jgi:hypothetical protein
MPNTSDCHGTPFVVGSICGLGAALGLYCGGIIGLAGALLGTIVGEFADRDRHVIYRGPVDQYRMR